MSIKAQHFTYRQIVYEIDVRERKIKDIEATIAKLDKHSVGDATAVDILLRARRQFHLELDDLKKEIV